MREWQADLLKRAGLSSNESFIGRTVTCDLRVGSNLVRGHTYEIEGFRFFTEERALGAIHGLQLLVKGRTDPKHKPNGIGHSVACPFLRFDTKQSWSFFYEPSVSKAPSPNSEVRWKQWKIRRIRFSSSASDLVPGLP